MTIAATDLDGLFPLIIGLIWVIAQIAGAAAKKKNAPPRPAARSGTEEKDSGDDPFAEFMRKLGGGQEFNFPEPLELPPDPEPIVDAVSPPRPQPVEINAVRTPRLQSTPEPVEVSEVDIHPAMSSFKSAMPSMKLPAMRLSPQSSRKSGSGLPKVGKIIKSGDKQSLRRAILGQIILGKPRAMESLNTGRMD